MKEFKMKKRGNELNKFINKKLRFMVKLQRNNITFSILEHKSEFMT